VDFENTKSLVYTTLGKNIAVLNHNFTINSHEVIIPKIEHVNKMYSTLGITDYHDYLHSASIDSQSLANILKHSPNLQAKTSSYVMADIIHSNAHIFGDLVEHVMKRLLKASVPLFTSVLLLGLLSIYENIHISEAATAILN
jgi:hypothetical protein